MYTVRPLCAFTIKKRLVRGIDSVDPALPEMWRVCLSRKRKVGGDDPGLSGGGAGMFLPHSR